MASSDEGQKFRARLCVDLDQTTGSETFGCKNIIRKPEQPTHFPSNRFPARVFRKGQDRFGVQNAHDLQGFGLQFFLAHEGSNFSPASKRSAWLKQRHCGTETGQWPSLPPPCPTLLAVYENRAGGAFPRQQKQTNQQFLYNVNISDFYTLRMSQGHVGKDAPRLIVLPRSRTRTHTHTEYD